MPMRACNGPAPGQPCPTGSLVEQGARNTCCPACRQVREQRRGTREQRGYGAEHRRTRAELLPLAYGTRCLHCGLFMYPHQALALDHTEDRSGYRGIVHASCNNSEGASRGNRLR